MLAPASTIGKGFTVIVTLSDAEHPFPSVPTKVYVIVDVGFAIGLKTVVLLSDVPGDQE